MMENTNQKKRKLGVEEICDSKIMKHQNTASDEYTHQYSLIPVISDEFHKEVETVQVFVGKVTDKKQTSRLLKELCNLWPLPGLTHLKRAKKSEENGVLDIIIRLVDNDDEIVSSENTLLKDVIDRSSFCSNGLADSVTVHSVPKFSPITSLQYKKSVSLWPVQYREDKYIESILNDKLFNNNEKLKQEEFMRMAINMAKYSKSPCVGAIIVDPSSGNIVAKAHDQRHQHPLKHVVMVAVDLVAKSQGGGAWDMDNDSFLYSLPCSAESSKHKMNVEISENEKLDTKKLSLPYICTSYDLYVTREPCVMCSMALVHSRIHRVFYGVEVSWGGLGSLYNIHIQSGLNHHYEVWKGLLREECLSI